MRILIERGLDVNTSRELGKTLLMSAAENGNIEMLRCLLANHAQINARDSNGATALHYGARGMQPEAVEILLVNGADPMARDYKGRDPLQYPNYMNIRSVILKAQLIVQSRKSRFHRHSGSETKVRHGRGSDPEEWLHD